MSGTARVSGTGAALRSRTVRTGEGQVAGHIVDPHAPERRFVVELLLDGYPAALGRADHYDPDLAREGFGDGCYGFVFSIAPAALQCARRVEIRLANSGEIVGEPLFVKSSPQADGNLLPGEARWESGLRFTGWVAGDPACAPRVRALVDGELAAEGLATRWTHVGDGANVRAFRRFDLHLPLRFADGRAHAATIVNEEGMELSGSPCAFAAFPDGLARFFETRAEIESERPRGALLDRLAPQSLPFVLFEDWRRAFPPPAPAATKRPKVAVALIGDAGIEASVASLEAQQDCDWVAGALEGGAEPAGFDSRLLQQFLDGEARDCPVVVFAPSGSVLQPRALALLAAALDAFPAASLAYADVTIPQSDGSEWPLALPAFDYEAMLEQGCGALFFAARADHVRAAAKAGAADLFQLFFHGQERRRSLGLRGGRPQGEAPVHQPGFLARLPDFDFAALSEPLKRAVEAHLSARGMSARLTPGFGALLPSVRVARAPPRGQVSILVPTRDRADLLAGCFDALARTVNLARHELIILDNDSVEAEFLALFERIAARGGRIIHVPGPFNHSRMINKGASAAHGEFLLLLDNDVEAREPGWLDEMLGRIAEPDVGAVGGMLIRPSGIVQHGGVVLGSNFAAATAFGDCVESDTGYADWLAAAHECSAVTGACLLTDKWLFQQSGGFDDAHFPLAYNEVDYCLKLRAKGLRVVMTPHARLLHRESGARGLRADATERFPRETRHLRAAWRDALLADPAYNPMLSLGSTPFSALAWPPRLAEPRQPSIKPPHPIPPGF
ncbi:glycosyltransferase [Rhodoblastus sp. 17X3]|uniref:glycosyltransferase family 2 protein n=1 Tax=Rhodoblastus sp. 17X3 TaxID=3047026 RepID=UPI0024B70828|nr:glycosyltransferase [Rhodoblastus sp. 17X3]MDI9850035.1 glycosyltransferase [Rhodoblastus sp. 17X3]